MKNNIFKKVIGILGIASFLILVSFTVLKEKNNTPKKNNNEVVVMELFTSQGCSSCPAADKVLGKYAAENNQNIITLSFHVDYWNYIGWKDPFSKSEYSARQREYSDGFDSSTYTPQLIINGKYQLIGSNETEIGKIVKEELKTVKPITIAINKITLYENDIEIDLSYNQNRPNSILNIALVKNKVITTVKRGENKDRILTNYNVVSDFKKIQLNPQMKNSIHFSLNKSEDISNYTIIAFVQENKNKQVLGATIKKLN